MRVLGLLSLMLLSICCGTQPTGTNTLAMYVVSEEIPWGTLEYGTAKPHNLSLERDPIFSGRDFVSYDLKSHRFSVTADAAKRFSNRMFHTPKKMIDGKEQYLLLGAPDTPFVLFAMGEPVYVGVFSSKFSSTEYALPTVHPEEVYVRAKGTRKVAFSLLEGVRTAPHVQVIDMRNDERVLEAVKRLGLKP